MTGPALIGGALALAGTVAIMGREVWQRRGRRDAASVARRLVDGGILVGALSLLLWGAVRQDVAERTGTGTVPAGGPPSLTALMGGTGAVLVLSIGGSVCAALLLAGQLTARRLPTAAADSPEENGSAGMRLGETSHTGRPPHAG